MKYCIVVQAQLFLPRGPLSRTPLTRLLHVRSAMRLPSMHGVLKDSALGISGGHLIENHAVMFPQFGSLIQG